MRMFHIYILLSVVNIMFLFDINTSEILYVTKSSNVTLRCPFKSVKSTLLWSGPPNLTSYSENSTVNSAVKDVGIMRGSENGEYNLIIYGFEESNEGAYQCSTLNDGKPVMLSFNVMMQIRKPILSMSISPSEFVIEGTNVSFECMAKSNPSPSLLRLNGPDGNVLKFNNIPNEEMMLRFIISDIRSNEIGNYTCTAENTFANGTATVWLNILYPPKVTISGRNYSETESYRSLECIADGNPNSYRYKEWEHSYYGQHIRNLSGYGNGTLILPFIDKTDERHEDSGSYKCFAGNDIPKSDFYQNANIFIQTTGRPVFLRRNLKAHYGKYGDSINIQFYIYSIPDVISVQHVRETPEKDHVNVECGTEKQHVTDTFHNKNVQLYAYVVTFRIPVIDLDDYYTYYTIEAKNINGNSRFTFQLRENTCYCPEVPYIKGVLPGTKSVSIDWSGGFNGGFPQFFLIEYKQASQEKWFVHINISETNETGHTAVINNLLPNEPYEVRMYAVNSMNRSQFTNVFNVTTGGTYDLSSNKISYLPVYITVGLGLFLTAMASVGYLWYKSENLKKGHAHSENRNSGQQEGNAAFNNIYDINENRQPTVPGASSASVVYSNFSRVEQDELLRTNRLPCRPSTSHIKPLDQQPAKQKPSELNYIEIDLDPIPQDRKFYIHGKDNRTEYSEIEIGVIGDPPQLSESETDDDNDKIDCMAINA